MIYLLAVKKIIIKNTEETNSLELLQLGNTKRREHISIVMSTNQGNGAKQIKGMGPKRDGNRKQGCLEHGTKDKKVQCSVISAMAGEEKKKQTTLINTIQRKE